MPVLEVRRRVKAHADMVWQVISDVGGLAEVAPHITKVDILEGGQLEGDITAPRLSIADGAHFRGKVDMEGGQRVSMPADAVASISGKVSA